MDTTILELIWLGITGYWCYRIALKNRRDKGLAIVFGILFGLIAVIVYWIIGKKKQKVATQPCKCTECKKDKCTECEEEYETEESDLRYKNCSCHQDNR